MEVYSLCFASTTVQVSPSENVVAPTVSASKYLFFSLIVTVNFNVKVHQLINGYCIAYSISDSVSDVQFQGRRGRV